MKAAHTTTTATTATTTTTAATRTHTGRTEWFASWFDSPYYHELYAHRSDTEAALFVDRLVHELQPYPNADALDLGCGAGRHARQLATHGLRVTGLDLSGASIDAARRFTNERPRFAQHDMRLPFGSKAFDYVFNLFTSFGYFENPQEHLAVVRNMAASLRRGGRLVLDYLNAEYAAAHQVRSDVVERDLARYRIERWSDEGHLFKRILVDLRGSNDRFEHVERVARFSLADFAFMFALYGLTIESVFGDYALTPFDPMASPRLVLVATKDR
ncbi:MAG TPA: class I SAM-dependent methyltransferase [Vicinamibacterales bacterium]|jgi:SAM-dependent methyltransferase